MWAWKSKLKKKPFLKKKKIVYFYGHIYKRRSICNTREKNDRMIQHAKRKSNDEQNIDSMYMVVRV